MPPELGDDLLVNNQQQQQIQGCGCTNFQEADWRGISGYARELARAEERLRNAGARHGRAGNFTAAAGSSGAGGIRSQIAATAARGTPYCQGGGNAQVVGGLGLMASAAEIRGRYLQAAHDYPGARSAFGSALGQYSLMLSTRPYPLSGSNEVTARLRHYGGLRSTNGQTCGLNNNRVLVTGVSGIPFIHLSRAQVLLSRVNIEDIPELTNPETTLDPARIESIFTRVFAPARGALGQARGSQGAFLSFVRGRYPGSAGYFSNRLSYRLQLADSRLTLGQAMILLQAANRLRVNNTDSALVAIDQAIAKALEALNGSLRTDPPETLLYGLTTLAWAYSSRANLLESQERGSGRDDAIRAAIIYRYLLQGHESLSQSYTMIDGSQRTGLEILANAWPRANEPRWSNALAFVSGSFENVMDGQRYRMWGGSTPDLLGGGSVSFDLLGMAGTNELEIYLNLADSLRTIRDYDSALAIYDQVLEVDRQDWTSNLLFMRARNGRAQIVVERADDIEGRNHNYDAAAEQLTAEDGTITLCEGVLSELLTATQNNSLNRLSDDRYIEFRSRTEMLKATTTLAWAYSSHARYLRELGRVDESLDYARRAELLYRALRGEVPSPDALEGVSASFREQFNQTLNMIRRNYAQAEGWGRDRSADLVRADLKAEVNISDSQISVGLGDALNLQRRFSDARDEYETVIDGYTSNNRAGRRHYYGARLGHADATNSMARETYTRTGDLDEAQRMLDTAFADLEEMRDNRNRADRPRTFERVRNQMLLAQTLSTRGWLRLQSLQGREGDNGANALFDQAEGIVNGLIREIDSGQLFTRSVSGQQLEDILKDAYLTRAQLHLIRAGILRDRGERDVAALNRANAEFARAREVYGDEGDTARSRLGRIEAQLGEIELGAFRARLLVRRGRYTEARTLIGSDIQARLRDEIIPELIRRRAPKLAFRAIRTLAWLLGLNGGYTERTRGEGTGSTYFVHAANLYRALMGQEPIYETAREGREWREFLALVRGQSDVLAASNFLILSDTTRADLIMTEAELWKAAGVRERSHLERARNIYTSENLQEEFAAIDNEHPLHFVGRNALNNARIGEAETMVTLGRLIYEEEADTPEEYQEVADLYRGALSANIGPVLDELNHGQTIRDLNLARLSLRSASALTWALSSLGELREQLEEEEGEDVTVRPQDEYLLSLIISRALIRGDMLGNTRSLLSRASWTSEVEGGFDQAWQEMQTRANELLGEGVLLEAVTQLRNNRNNVTNDEVLFASGTNMWSLRFGFVGSHISARLYGEAIHEYRDAISDMEDEEYVGIRELEFVADIHSAIGDVYTYKLQRYGNAVPVYDSALESIAQYLAAFENGDSNVPQEVGSRRDRRRMIDRYLIRNHDVPVRMQLIRHRVLFGFAKVAVERMQPRRALAFYNTVLESPEYANLTREVEAQRGARMRELRADLTRRQVRTLAQGYSGLGDLQNYYLRDANQAENAYRRQIFLLSGLGAAPFQRSVAQSYLGLGNVERLRRRDFADAVSHYDRGLGIIDGMRDRESRKIRAQLLAAKASAQAALGNMRQARELIEQAFTVINSVRQDPYDQDRDDIREMIIEARRDILASDRTRRAGAVDVHYRLTYVSSTWRNVPTDEGFEHSAGACVNPGRDMRLCFDYTSGLDTDLPQFSAAGEMLDRMSADRRNSFRIGFDFNREVNRWNLRVRPYLEGHVFNYRITEHQFSEDFNTVDQAPGYPNVQENTLVNLVPGIGIGADYRIQVTPETLLLVGADFDFNALISMGPNPSAEASRTSLREIEAATGRDMSGQIEEVNRELENGPLFSWSLNPRATLILPSWHIYDREGRRILFAIRRPTIRLGGTFGQDPRGVTANGFWPLRRIEENQATGERTVVESETDRLAFTIGFSTALAFGEQGRFQIPIFFDAQVGNYTYIRGGLGFEYNANSLSAALLCGASWFNDEANESSTTAVDCSFRLNF